MSDEFPMELKDALNKMREEEFYAATKRAGEKTVDESPRHWFYIENANGKYYSPFTMEGYTEYKLIGEGIDRPTPMEIKEALDKDPEWYFSHREGLLARTVADEEEFKKNKKMILPGGVYYFTHGGGAPARLVPFEMRTDTGIVLSQFYDMMVPSIQQFLTEKTDPDFGLHKLGLLLYGDPGNGKTTLIRRIVQEVMPEDSIVVFFNEMPPPDFLMTLKKESRMKIVIFEEMTNFIGYSGKAQESILSFLDGEMSFDNCIVFGTTNYPDNLPGNLVDRPSRFDKVIKIDNLNDDSRTKLLQFYLKKDPTPADVKATKSMSIAYIKEACMLHHKQKLSIEAAVKQLRDYHDLVKKEFRASERIGI